MTPQSSQLSLFDARAPIAQQAQRVAFWLSKDLGMPVRLAVTDNRTSMVSFRRRGTVLQLRLHHMFLSAPDLVLKALADYAGRGLRRGGPALDRYIHGQEPLIRRTSRKTQSSVRGTYFDLQDIFDRLNAQHFFGSIRAQIGWGRHPKKRRRRSIRLGVYDHHTREIRIHPALDRPHVPLFFVEFIVFHEMLHQLFPSSPPDASSSNRRGQIRHVHHPPAFRDREKSFPLYEQALRWERSHLHSLLRS